MNSNIINEGAAALTLSVVLLGLLFCMFSEAYIDGFFSVGQMIKKGFTKGIPITGHGGLLNDPFLVLCVGFIFWKYFAQWSPQHICIAFAIGFAVSILMHVYLYVPGGIEIPEALTHGGRLTSAGKIHVEFFAIAFGTLVLFFFFTPHIDPTHLFWVTLFVGFHVFVGNHMILGMIRPTWMGKDYLRDIPAWISIILVWGLLAVRYWTILRRV